MREFEKILEEMKRIKDGNRKEKLYAKYPPNSKDQGVLNAYSQGYEDGTDNFYNAIKESILKLMNSGWIPVDERLPENNDDVLATTFDGDVICAWYNMASKKWFGYEEEEIIAWRPLPEPYRPERRAQNGNQ